MSCVSKACPLRQRQTKTGCRHQWTDFYRNLEGQGKESKTEHPSRSRGLKNAMCLLNSSVSWKQSKLVKASVRQTTVRFEICLVASPPPRILQRSGSATALAPVIAQRHRWAGVLVRLCVAGSVLGCCCLWHCSVNRLQHSSAQFIK